MITKRITYRKCFGCTRSGQKPDDCYIAIFKRTTVYLFGIPVYSYDEPEKVSL